jgi:hypothetical protein
VTAPEPGDGVWMVEIDVSVPYADWTAKRDQPLEEAVWSVLEEFGGLSKPEWDTGAGFGRRDLQTGGILVQLEPDEERTARQLQEALAEAVRLVFPTAAVTTAVLDLGRANWLRDARGGRVE